MAYQRLNKNNIAEFKSLIDQLTPESPRQWGTLAPIGVLSHLCRTFEISIGKYIPKDESNFFTRTVLFRKLLFQVMPWPKGKIKGPDYITPEPIAEFDGERQRLFILMDEFVDILDRTPNEKIRNPFLGNIPFSFWSIMHGRHTCWHLEQFAINTQKMGGKAPKIKNSTVSA